MEALEETISSEREALALCPPGHPQHPASLSNLGVSLNTRYNQLGRTEDLEESISVAREALRPHPPHQSHHDLFVSNLAACLRDRFNNLGRIDSEVIEDLKENLADSLRTRYEQLGKLEDLEESILLERGALTFRSLGHPHHPASLGSLALSLRRYIPSGVLSKPQGIASESLITILGSRKDMAARTLAKAPRDRKTSWKIGVRARRAVF